MPVIHHLISALLLACLAILFALIAVGIGIRMPHLFDLLPLLLGLAMGYIGRAWLSAHVRHRSLYLAAASLFSAWCLQYLKATVLLASIMGLPLPYTMARAGLVLLNHLAYMATNTLFIIASLCGCLIAVLFSLRSTT